MGREYDILLPVLSISRIPQRFRAAYPFAIELPTTKRTPTLIQAYAFSRCSTFWYSRRMFFSSSFLRTGRFLNISSTVTAVPLVVATIDFLLSFPDVSKSSLVPFGPSEARAVTTWNVDKAQREDSASPRKPKV
jgi:hypothetical protein